MLFILGQKKPPFFGNGIAPIDVKKKTLKTNDVTQPTTSSSKRIKHQTSSDLANSTYPVHGEALLKDESKNTSTLPSITASSPIVKTKTETNQGRVTLKYLCPFLLLHFASLDVNLCKLR